MTIQEQLREYNMLMMRNGAWEQDAVMSLYADFFGAVRN